MEFSDEEQEVLDFLRSEQVSYYGGDFEAFIDHWHHGPEVRWIISGPTVGTRVHIGWENLREKSKEGFRRYPQDYDALEILQWENVQVHVSGDIAWASYDLRKTQPVEGIHAADFSHEQKYRSSH